MLQSAECETDRSGGVSWSPDHLWTNIEYNCAACKKIFVRKKDFEKHQLEDHANEEYSGNCIKNLAGRLYKLTHSNS